MLIPYAESNVFPRSFDQRLALCLAKQFKDICHAIWLMHFVRLAQETKFLSCPFNRPRLNITIMWIHFGCWKFVLLNEDINSGTMMLFFSFCKPDTPEVMDVVSHQVRQVRVKFILLKLFIVQSRIINFMASCYGHMQCTPWAWPQWPLRIWLY